MNIYAKTVEAIHKFSKSEFSRRIFNAIPYGLKWPLVLMIAADDSFVINAKYDVKEGYVGLFGSPYRIAIMSQRDRIEGFPPKEKKLLQLLDLQALRRKDRQEVEGQIPKSLQGKA